MILTTCDPTNKPAESITASNFTGLFLTTPRDPNAPVTRRIISLTPLQWVNNLTIAMTTSRAVRNSLYKHQCEQSFPHQHPALAHWHWIECQH